METKKTENKLQFYIGKLDEFICRVDKWPLIWTIIPLMIVFFSYYFLLGKNCVIEINDQLDETLFTYVLNAKYMFSDIEVFPEMLGGVPRGGVTVSAWIFIIIKILQRHIFSCLNMFHTRTSLALTSSNIICQKSQIW